MCVSRQSTTPRAPTEKPPFTLSQIKQAIPPHCFQRSFLRSFSYVFYDLTAIFLIYCLANNYIDLLPKSISYFAWPIYGFVQGCFFTGLWILAHECGHHAFSDYQWLDDTVGFVLHSLLLTPYFSWKYSHRRHHLNPGSIEKDEVHVPRTKANVRWYTKKFAVHPLGRAMGLFISLALGLHMYFLFNIYGRKYKGFASHYYPYAPIYSDNERLQVYISDVGILIMIYVLFRVTITKGLVWMWCIYGGPLLVMNSFIILITLLHHTHPSIPRYNSSEWDWLRGALATVDRDYGILNKIFHNIADTHVAHHLFSSLPHYHAVEATQAIKPILGKYYQFDGTSIYKALWREFKECLYVEADDKEGDNGVFWYKNKLDDKN